MGLTHQAVDLIAGNDPGLRARAESVAREILADAKRRNLTSPEGCQSNPEEYTSAIRYFRSLCTI
jgi:hypothetical protein